MSLISQDEGFDVNDTFVINVGGVRHEVLRATLERHKGTKLANLASLKAYYRRDRDEYFFDRDPFIFAAILNYYRTGELHMTQGCCGLPFKHELDFWDLDEENIEECCWIKYCSDKATKQSLLSFDHMFPGPGVCHETDGGSRWENVCLKVMSFIDEPSSSVYAKVYMVTCFLFVLLSLTVFCVDTFPGMSRKLNVQEYANFYDVNVTTLLTDWYDVSPEKEVNMLEIDLPLLPRNNTEYRRDDTLMVPNRTLMFLDIAYMVFFSLELIIRFIFTSKKLRFFTNWLNILDFISVLPFYVELIAHSISLQQLYTHNMVDVLLILKVLRIFRLLRLLRHYKGLQVLVLTLKSSWRELLLLCVFIGITMLVFASLIYFCNKNSTFKSIPHSFWWAIITMTTVGYGDMAPSTDAGYVIGALCALSGVLVIAFAMPTIVGNFLMFYTHVLYRKHPRNDRTDPEKQTKNALHTECNSAPGHLERTNISVTT